MVAIAKLASSTSKSSTNSLLVVRGSLRRANTHGGTLSVAKWTRKMLEENLEWVVKLVKRHAEGEKAIFLRCGDGCETLLLLDGKVIDSPDDLKTVKKIPVGRSMAEIYSNFDKEKLAAMGVLQPKDSIWEPLCFETIGAIKPQADEKWSLHSYPDFSIRRQCRWSPPNPPTDDWCKPRLQAECCV
jgi:hypothetical protein